MAVQKNFVVRNGLEVNNNLLVADSSTDYVGIGTSSPKYTLEVIGGIGVTYVNVLGITTVAQEFNVGTGGTVITSLNTGLTGFGTQSPAYIVDIRSPVSTGQTALYVQGDVRVTGDVYADDINLDQATFTNLEVTGVSTFVGVTSSQSTLFANNLSVAGFSTFRGTTAVLTDDIAVFTVGQNIDGTGEDHFGIYYDNGITPGVGGTATLFTSNGDIRVDVNDGLSNIIFGDGGITNDLLVLDIPSHTSTVDGNLEITGGNRVSGIASINTGVVTTAYINTGIVTTLSGSNISYSGIGSFGSVNTPTARITTGIVTTIDNANLTVSGIASINTGVITTAYINTGIVTTLSGSNLDYSGIGTITTASIDLAYVKTGIATNLTTSGIGTIATAVIDSAYINTGIVTTLTGTTLNYSGVGTISDFHATDATVSGLTTTGSLAVASGFDVYASDSTFHGSLTIDGNLSIGGTSAILNAVQVRIEDKDIILGFTTAITPSDDTANHGGIAIASTEGTPLVPLYAAGINTLPDTYKQIMWVKRNTMGAGTTDAFLFNYGVGIGSTQVPDGVRLAVGSVQITDTNVNASNLNASGVTTSNSYNVGGTQVISSGRELQNIASLDATTTATIEAAIANAPNTFTDITVSGLSTFVGVSTFNSGVYVSGIATFQNNVSIADSANLYIGTGNDLRIFHNGANSFIQDNGTGNLFIDASNTYYRAASHLIQNNSSSETLATFTENGSVALYFDNSKKFETTGYGATVYGALNVSGIVTGSSFRPSTGYYQSANGTNSFYVYDGTGNVSFQGTIGVNQINNGSGYKALEFSSSTTPNVLVTNGLEVSGLSTVANFRITPIGSGATVGNSGIVTYYGDGSQLSNIISGVGIQSAGTLVGTGFTTLNFIGAGNTFAVNGTTIDISISGGGAGAGGTWTTYNAGIATSKSVGVHTSTIDEPNLTGVGNSFNGLYVANGMIIVDNQLNGDHYIGTSYNGLMAGPVTINGTLTVDGNYVVV